MIDINSMIMGLFPEGFDPIAMLQVFAFITAAVVILGLIGRMAFGKGSGLAHAVASSIAILFVYTFIAVLYGIDGDSIKFVIDKLPLITFDGETVHLFQFSGAAYADICTQFLHVLILTVLVIVLDDLIPDARNTLSWFILQFVIACFATLVYCFVIHCLDTYLPGLLVSHAPMILISILLFMLLLGVLKVVLGLMLTVVNPLFGAVYTFFFASRFGKSISKAVLSSLVLCALVIFVEELGYASFAIVGGTLMTFLPLLLLLLILWFLLGYVL